ncbi:nucleotidyltransferase family protein [Catenuloplanes japonicus]|uniref:nucleotidyltransferase n=1 Tax=Catenuloplanes japonicus TaxID=33876 RepID=UPI000526E892|nr:nucleotidyltransferase [Catenuloplanes japonicus]
MDAVGDARALVQKRFPEAVWAVLTGSVLGAARTAGSDLDILVMREAGTGFRESLYFRGWPVELFVHTPERLDGFLASELAQRRPTAHRMLARGVPLCGDPGALQARCARVLADGPPPLTDAERDRLRYELTDLLDDYRHGVDQGERAVIAAELWAGSARVALAAGGRWVSHGKWLLRELREWDPELAARWTEARDEPAAFAEEVLDRAGGPLFDGYRAS